MGNPKVPVLDRVIAHLGIQLVSTDTKTKNDLCVRSSVSLHKSSHFRCGFLDEGGNMLSYVRVRMYVRANTVLV